MAPDLLKVDFHTHTADDPKDYIDFSARDLIDRAAGLGYDALAITNHEVVTFSRRLEAYAEKRGVLLLPGIELELSGKHVVIVGPELREPPPLRSLDQLAGFRNDRVLIIAPHPFYPGLRCLRSELRKHIDSFDAVEFSFFYSRLINKNKKAVALAREHAKPLLGSSDCHNLWQVGYTHSLVAAEKSLPQILAAVKEGKVEVATSPLSLASMARVGFNWVLGDKLRVHLRI